MTESNNGIKRQGIFRGSNALWNYMVVNASLRSHIIHHDQSGLSRPNHKGEKEGKINTCNVVKR